MRPFIKWAGGKGQLVDRIIERMPESYNNYFEPFVGGGALLFALEPKNAVINDINKELVNVYLNIKNNVEELMEVLSNIDDNHLEPHKEYYYSQRLAFNQKILAKEYDVEMAALFIYLNKHCFNGLYRVNQKGLFNVPFNNRIKGDSYSEENLKSVQVLLKRTQILNLDFEEAVINAMPGDFVFFDSPYAPLNDTSFESYTKTGFAYEEHVRLSKLFKKLSEQGVFCMLTNHNTELVNELYADYEIEAVSVKRMINSNSNNRVGEEVIITNY